MILLCDCKTTVPIEDLYVGRRVATDAGVANSPDGKTAAADPNATGVDPATWRLVTIRTSDGDWQVQTLQPQSWIAAHGVVSGARVELSDVVDLREMGTPDGLYGTVVSVDACPAIESGTGRVVLTTVNHLNDNVYDLTLTDAAGKADTIGVTGYHKIYTEDRGWADASSLTVGEVVRGDHGALTVTALSCDPGTFRVYNMTVESDHVYYVSHLSALVHNVDCEAVIQSSQRQASAQIQEGARALQKKIGHAASGGYQSAFAGIKGTQANAEAIIRDIIGNTVRTDALTKYTDLYNAIGQGLRVENGTNKFIGFLEALLAS